MIQTTTNDSLAFAMKILCFEKLQQTQNSTLMKLAVSIHWTGVTDSNGIWEDDIAIGTGGVRRTRLIDDRFTVRIHCKNKNKHRSGRSRC